MTDRLSDYDFVFDEERIALRPVVPRSAAKLLYYKGNEIHDRLVGDYKEILDENDLLVFNDTKVLSARLDGFRRRNTAQGESRAKTSVTLLEPINENGEWRALIRPLKKVDVNEWIDFADDFSAQLITKEGNTAVLAFETQEFSSKLSQYGRMPLPPYIENKRKSDRRDFHDYQPLQARVEGAVASPTASLHFDETLRNALRSRGVNSEMITLHVGAGTFLPVKSENVKSHKMHAERGAITSEVARRINAHRAKGGRVIAVGTTSLRLLESAAIDGKLNTFVGDTDIFIRPGFQFQIVDGLITNFHLPKSTLLMLVAAFVGFEEMHRIYQHACDNEYRFFSYGDSSLLLREK